MRHCIWPFLTVFLCTGLLTTARAQTNDGDFVWVKQFGGPNRDGYLDNGIAVDAAGNTYISGAFRDTVDFDPGPGTHELTSLGLNDVFTAKLDASGNLVWAKQIVAGPGGGEGYDIAVDSSGNVYVTGRYGLTADFDPGPGSYDLTVAGRSDVFVSKLDANGNFVWARHMGDAGVDEALYVAVDNAGSVYTSGTFEGSVDFDPGPGTFTLTSDYNEDGGSWRPAVFVSKLDAAGNFAWAIRRQEFGYGFADGLALDGTGNTYFQSTVSEPALIKLDSGGDIVWEKQNVGGLFALGSTGNLYLAGGFWETVDMDPGPGVYELTQTGGLDMFVLKLDPAGNFVWAKQIGGPAGDVGPLAIAVDGGENVYTTGYYEATLDFDPSPSTYSLTSNGEYDIFVSKLGPDGDFIWAKGMGGGAYQDHGHDITVDGAGNAYVTGTFELTVDFDPGPGTYNLNSNGQWDIFVLKLAGSGGEGEGEGEITVDPQFALFSDQAVDAGPTSPYMITVGNTGTGNLGITGVTRTGADAPHFVVSSDTGQATLTPAEERSIGIAFDPSSVGDKIAYLTIESDDATDPVVHVYLWGHAYAVGEIQVTPMAYTWPYQSIPDAPAMPGAVTITNTGTGGLSLSSVGLTGTNPGQFLITDDTSQYYLSASQSRMVDVTFNPSTTGPKTASLHITSNDADEPTVDVSLSGIGFDPIAGYTSPVWVDANYTGTETGSETQPYNTLAEGCDLVLSGGVIKVKAGRSNEALRIEKAMRIEAVSAPATIGALASGPETRRASEECRQ